MSKTTKPQSALQSDLLLVKSDVEILKNDVAQLKTDVVVLKTDVAQLKTDVEVLKTDVAQLKIDVEILKTDVAQLKIEVKELRQEFYEFRDEMRAEIKGLRELILDSNRMLLQAMGEKFDEHDGKFAKYHLQLSALENSHQKLHLKVANQDQRQDTVEEQVESLRQMARYYLKLPVVN